MKLSELGKPFVCCVVIDTSLPEAIRTVRMAQYEGADAFEVNLPRLDYPEPSEIKSLFACTDLPLFTSCRRDPFMKVYGPSPHAPRGLSEQARMEIQLEAIKSGAAGLDMELDTFDPRPYDGSDMLGEWTLDARAVESQRQLIERAHQLGGEVVASCHPGRMITPEEAVKIGLAAQERGADFVKIVALNRSLEDVVETLRCNVAMHAAVNIPFNMMSMGRVSTAGRPVFPLFGSSWVYGQLEFLPGGLYDQPPIRALKSVLSAVDFRVPKPEDVV